MIRNLSRPLPRPLTRPLTSPGGGAAIAEPISANFSNVTDSRLGLIPLMRESIISIKVFSELVDPVVIKDAGEQIYSLPAGTPSGEYPQTLSSNFGLSITVGASDSVEVTGRWE